MTDSKYSYHYLQILKFVCDGCAIYVTYRLRTRGTLQIAIESMPRQKNEWLHKIRTNRNKFKKALLSYTPIPGHTSVQLFYTGNILQRKMSNRYCVYICEHNPIHRQHTKPSKPHSRFKDGR